MQLELPTRMVFSAWSWFCLMTSLIPLPKVCQCFCSYLLCFSKGRASCLASVVWFYRNQPWLGLACYFSLIEAFSLSLSPLFIFSIYLVLHIQKLPSIVVARLAYFTCSCPAAPVSLVVGLKRFWVVPFMGSHGLHSEWLWPCSVGEYLNILLLTNYYWWTDRTV